ncbi:MAG: LptF/LptG family permease [Chlamydiota bacterium]|nr:LptF/LptG family permease [Chlamydiota bacterium]
MSTLSKYIVKEFIMPFCYTLMALFLIYLIADLFEHMDEFLRAGLSLSKIAEYYTYMIPIIFVQIAPFAFVLSLIFELGIFARHNEVVAMKASGISPKYIAFPLVMTGLLISCLILICDQWLIPLSYLKTADYETLISQDANQSLKTANTDITYSNLKDHYIFNIQWLENNEAKDIQVHHSRPDGTLESCVRAKAGAWMDGHWWFFDGALIRYNEHGAIIAPSDFFKKQMMDYRESPETLSLHKDALQMNFIEYRKLLKMQYDDMIPPAKIVELQYKISNSATCLILGLIVVPFGLRIARSGAFSALGKAMLMTFSFYGFQTIMIVLGKQELSYPYLCVWSIPALFACLGLYQIARLR